MTNNSINVTNKDMQKYDVIKKLINKQIVETEAGLMLGLSTRQIRRIKKRVIQKGIKGLLHKNKGSPGNRGFNPSIVNEALSIIKDKYHDFKPTFASEKLMENHGIRINRESLRLLMTQNGLWKPKHRKSPKNIRTWRARKDNYGEMIQFDGSYHLWLEDRNGGDELCLLLAVDDATGKITHAKFDINEGTVAVHKFWNEYLEKNGIPISIYLDKFSTYKINHPSAINNKDLMTQFQRACNQIGIDLITAHSPEAKGRVERMNGTLQDRLVKEMRLANISTTEEANEFLIDYIPMFNKQFGVVANNQSNIHKPLRKELRDNLSQIFSIQSQRKIYNNLTVSYKSNLYLLDKNQKLGVYKKEYVTIEEYSSGEIKIFYKDSYINYTQLPERSKNQRYTPVKIDRRGTTTIKPKHNHPWKRTLYGSNLEQNRAAINRRDKFEEMNKKNKLNLDINKVAI